MIHNFLQAGFANAVAAAVLAVMACILARVIRRPQVVHALWLIVLLKFVTPPLFHMEFPLPWAGFKDSADRSASLPRQYARSEVSGDRANGLPTDCAQPSLWQADADHLAVVRASSNEIGADVAALTTGEAAEVERAAPAEYGHSSVSDSFAESHFLAASEPQRSLKPAEGNTGPELSSPPHFLASSMPGLIFAAWLLGSVAWSLLAAWRLLRFAKLVRRADAADDWVAVEAARLARRLGLRRPPEVRVANVWASPLVWSMGWRPIILLPAGLGLRLDRRQVCTLLTHELAHVRRGDHFVRWLEMAVLALFWWCPVAWWGRRRLRQAEEDCCDAWVAWALPDDRRAYAAAVLESVELLSARPAPLPLAASGLASVTLLERRLEMILHGQPHRRLSGGTRLALFVGAALVLPLAADVASQDAATSAENSAAGLSSAAGSDDSDAAVDASSEIGGVASADAVVIAEGATADAADFDVLGAAATSESSDSAFTPADRFGPKIADSADATTTVIASGSDSNSRLGTPELAAPSPTSAHTVVAQAQLVNEGTQIDLRYQAVRPVVEHLALVDGRKIAQNRWVVEEIHTIIPLNTARVAVIGQDTLSDDEIRQKLASPRTVVVTPAKSEVLKLLTEGTVVVLRDLKPNVVESNPATIAATAGLGDANVPTTLAAQTDVATVPANNEFHSATTSTPRAGQTTVAADDAITASGTYSARGAQGVARSWPVPHRVSAATAVADGELGSYLTVSESVSGRQPIVLKMDSDGNVLVLGQKMPLDRLADVMKAMSFLNEPPRDSEGVPGDHGQPVEVVLALPESVSASHAVKVVEVCREAGFEKLRLQVHSGRRTVPAE